MTIRYATGTYHVSPLLDSASHRCVAERGVVRTGVVFNVFMLMIVSFVHFPARYFMIDMHLLTLFCSFVNVSVLTFVASIIINLIFATDGQSI